MDQSFRMFVDLKYNYIIYNANSSPHVRMIIVIVSAKSPHVRGFPSGIIRKNWNDAEKLSMAPAQG